MTDKQLVQAIARRDEAAIRHVIRKYSRLLWSVVRSVLGGAGPEEDMEECVADAFIYLWEHPERFRPESGKLRSWLCIVARSRAIDRYRRLSKLNSLSAEDIWMVDEMEAVEDPMAYGGRQTVLEAVAALPEPDREIIVRRYYYEQKPRQIALAMALPVKQIDNRLYRAKRRLREMLESEGENV